MTPIRQLALDLLKELSERYPDMRLGQLVANFSSLARGPKPEAVYDVEDEEFVAAARRHLEKRGLSACAPAPLPTAGAATDPAKTG